MPPRRFRMMAQRNMIRRDCASQKNLLPNDVWLAEEKLLLIVLRKRQRQRGVSKGCRREGSCGWNFLRPSDPFLKVAIDQIYLGRGKHICQVV